MNRKKAFAVSVEFILVLVLCTSIAGVCLAYFTDNLGGLFSPSRNYKQLFERVAD